MQTPAFTLTAPGLSPDRSDRTTFTARAIALDDWRKNYNVPEMTLAIAGVYNNAVDCYNNAGFAAAQVVLATAQQVASAASAAAAATSVGAAAWVSGTTYALNVKVTSPANGRIYFRKVAGAGTTDPSADATNWGLLVNGLIPVVVSATTATAAAGFVYILTNAALTTVTLPATPLAGDTVAVMAQNGRTDNLIMRNGSSLMVDKSTGLGLAEDMTYDAPWITPTKASEHRVGHANMQRHGRIAVDVVVRLQECLDGVAING